MESKNPKITFDKHANRNNEVGETVSGFLNQVKTLETHLEVPVVIFQDGVSKAYYIKCSITASGVAQLIDLDAKLDLDSAENFRSNRELLLQNRTFLKMKEDAQKGREFNDIIVEYNTSYTPDKPLKVWGGQHRSRSLSEAEASSERYHGFRIYFDLTKQQRTDLALVSNTNISVSNDTFDRLIEETVFGDSLRKWCQAVGFLKESEDFPDVGSKSEKITVKKARSFVVNFYIGKRQGKSIQTSDLDKRVYEPYLVETGVSTDPKYQEIMEKEDVLKDEDLLKAGKQFLILNNAQYKAIEKGSVRNARSYRNKAMIESVLCGWSYVAGLLQSHPERLKNHYHVPKTNNKIPDPLNAEEMSKYKHDSDAATYRGLGTRAAMKDRQRIAQVFLAKSLEKDCTLDRKLLEKAVSQVVGLLTLQKGYDSNA
jgi:hypothetical protein